MDFIAKTFEKVLIGGPWALLVIIVFAWLAADMGLVDSQPKRTAETLIKHEEQTKQGTEKLQEIKTILQQQADRQAEAARIMCLNQAKTKEQAIECGKIK